MNKFSERLPNYGTKSHGPDDSSFHMRGLGWSTFK